MNGSKKVRNINSITNKISIYGDLGGLMPSANRKVINDPSRRSKGANNMFMPVPGLNPAAPNEFGEPNPKAGTTGRAYMMGQNPLGRYMMSRNPVCSGGVGRRPPYYKLNTPISQEEAETPTPPTPTGYTFTQRGAPGWPLAEEDYNALPGTLLYAIDLYSNPASNSQAIELYGDINTWKFDFDYDGSLKDFSFLFTTSTNPNRNSYVNNFNYDIGNWDVSGVTNMMGMFWNPSFNQDISDWNVSNVLDMLGMFFEAQSFNQDISDWNVSSVTRMATMFLGAQSFNQDISDWNVSSVTDMALMFQGATNMSQDISDWNVSSVSVSDGFDYIFDDATQMLLVLNSDGFIPDKNASADGQGPGSWFLGGPSPS